MEINCFLLYVKWFDGGSVIGWVRFIESQYTCHTFSVNNGRTFPNDGFS